MFWLIRISWLVLALLIASLFLVSSFLSGDYVIFDYISLIPQWLFIFPLVFLALTVRLVWKTKKYRLIFSIMLVFISLMWLQQVDVVIFRQKDPRSPVFKVISWNTARWEPSRKEEFVAQLKAHDADIYLLQEVHFQLNRELHGEMTNNYFPGYQAGHYGEFFTLSKFPLSCETPERTGVFLACRALIDNQYVTLLNVHLKRPFYVTNFETFEDFGTRWQQFTALNSYVQRQIRPVIIGGDFNSTSNYPFVRELRERYEMNNPSGLFAFPHTFPANFAYMRIDYQFASAPYSFCGYEEIQDNTLSDHVGIVGSVCIRTQ